MKDEETNSKHDTEQVFLESLKSQLRESESSIDNDTLARLHQARRVALDALPGTDIKRDTQQPVIALADWHNWLLPAGSVAATVAIAVLMFNLAAITREPQSRVENETLSVMDDMAILSAPDEIDLYQDLEFYEWLSADKEFS